MRCPLHLQAALRGRRLRRCMRVPDGWGGGRLKGREAGKRRRGERGAFRVGRTTQEKASSREYDAYVSRRKSQRVNRQGASPRLARLASLFLSPMATSGMSERPWPSSASLPDRRKARIARVPGRCELVGGQARE